MEDRQYTLDETMVMVSNIVDKKIKDLTGKSMDVMALMELENDEMERYHEYRRLFMENGDDNSKYAEYLDYNEIVRVYKKVKPFLSKHKLNEKVVRELTEIKYNLSLLVKEWDDRSRIVTHIKEEEKLDIGLTVEKLKVETEIDAEATRVFHIIRKIGSGISLIIKDHYVREKERANKETDAAFIKEKREGKKLLNQFIDRSDFIIMSEKMLKSKKEKVFKELCTEATVKIAVITCYMNVVNNLNDYIEMSLEPGTHRGENNKIIDNIRDEIKCQYDKAKKTSIVDMNKINSYLRSLIYETGLDYGLVETLRRQAEDNESDLKKSGKAEKEEDEPQNSLNFLKELV